MRQKSWCILTFTGQVLKSLCWLEFSISWCYRQQYLWSQPVAVVVWAWQAPPGGPVHRADSGKAWCYCKRSPAQACGRAKTGLQDGSSLIRSKGWYIEVYSMMRMLYTVILCYMQGLHKHTGFFHFWLQDRLCCVWSMYAGMSKHQHCPTARLVLGYVKICDIPRYTWYIQVYSIYHVWTELAQIQNAHTGFSILTLSRCCLMWQVCVNVQTLENHPEMQYIIVCIYSYMHCISRHALPQTCIYSYMHCISKNGRGSGFQMHGTREPKYILSCTISWNVMI